MYFACVLGSYCVGLPNVVLLFGLGIALGWGFSCGFSRRYVVWVCAVAFGVGALDLGVFWF